MTTEKLYKIAVKVEATFLPDQSDVEASRYVFSYAKKITNINLANGQFVTATLAVNTTFTFTIGGKAGTSGTNATSFTLVLTNDGTAGRSITWPAAVKWAGGSLPTRTTAANRTDVYTFFTFDNGTTWWGALSLFNYA